MPYKDPAMRREASRRNYHKNKHRWADRSEQKRIQRLAEYEERETLLAVYPCRCCGNPDPTVIQWHHVFPEEKLFGIKDGAASNRDRWWEEVLKCIPVCANCHVKIHKEKLCLLPMHL